MARVTGVDLAAGGGDRKPSMTAVPASLLLALKGLAEPAIWRVLARSLAVSLVAFVLVAAGGWWLVDALLERAGLGEALIPGAEALRGAAAALLAGLGLWLSWRIVAMTVIQFFADEVVGIVERRHYPRAAAAARDPSLGAQARSAARSAGRALLANLIALPVALALLVTGVGAALVFFLVNAWLVGRELQDMVWLRHASARGGATPISRGERFVLGGVVAALLVVPFVNFLAPVLGAASAAHLLHRKDRES